MCTESAIHKNSVFWLAQMMFCVMKFCNFPLLSKKMSFQIYRQTRCRNINYKDDLCDCVYATERVLLADRQHSKTEYLPGMIHTDSPAGLLPRFPSWSLVCLGKASTYNHNQGPSFVWFEYCCSNTLKWEFFLVHFTTGSTWIVRVSA